MDTATANYGNEIAIIGMACRFPGAKDLDTFWQNIRSGVESITSLSDEQLLAAGVDPTLLHHPDYVKTAVVLDDIELFDASFFDISPREAEIMDPQQRLFLEYAWEALENAGYDSQTYDKWIGVYGGASSSGYLRFNLASHPGLIEKRGPLQVELGNDKDFLTTRVSYKLNLNGPSITVQTACSTSLVALHLACQSLQAGECSMALVGGVSISIPHKHGYLYQEGELAAPDGHCRSFDAHAQGSIKGSGVGIVVLKLLAEALQDGDTIHAVIKGSAINNDGSMKVSFTAPSVNRQAQVIAEAIAEADIDPSTITYIEAHGSGTPLGDPIEITALTKAFRKDTAAQGFCAIGSVKTNMGHLDTAAGIAGLIKTVLALQNKMIPPSLNFKQPNPNIDFAHSPFYVNTELTPWTPSHTPRRAGVSSFGMGGTNAHVILEEAPVIESTKSSRSWQLVLLSAKTQPALESTTDKLVAYLKQHPDQNLADIAYTYQIGRRPFFYRRMLVCQHFEDALQALETRDTRRVLTHTQQASLPPIAFLFPGVGDHYVSMALELYETEAVFRKHVDTCFAILKRHQDLDLRNVLYPDQEQPPTHNQVVSSKPSKTSIDLRAMLNAKQRNTDPSAQRLNQTSVSQPVLFVVEYALAQLLMSWGIQPQAMLGYSLGEYVAACLAGVFSLDTALEIVLKRAQLIQTLPECSMLAISQSVETIQPLLPQKAFISAINGPTQCIVSGTIEHIAELENHLAGKDIVYRRLQTSHAFHSPMLEPLTEAFTALFATIKLNPPTIPLISNVTGNWMTAEEAVDPCYWATHLCQTVRFADGVHTLLQETGGVLLEVGPGQALCSLVMQDTDPSNQNTVALPILRPYYDQRSDREFLLNTLGKLWMMGVPIDWSSYHDGERRRRIPLPTYPFERQRYWIEAKQHRYEASQLELRETLQPDKNGQNTSVLLHPRSHLLNDYVAPSSEIERSLASVWQDLLGIDQVGIHDNFFELGGNSLASIQLVNRLRQVFQVPIPLDYPFKTPILADLATVIEEMFLEKLEALSEEAAQELVSTVYNLE